MFFKNNSRSLNSFCKFFLIFFLLFLVTSCNRGPSEKDVKKAILGSFMKDPLLRSMMKIKNFKVLNRYKVNNIWVVEAKTDVVFLKNEKELEDEIKRRYGNNFLLETSKLMALGVLASYCGGIKKGKLCSFEGKYKLVKSDKGWITINEK